MSQQDDIKKELANLAKRQLVRKQAEAAAIKAEANAAAEAARVTAAQAAQATAAQAAASGETVYKIGMKPNAKNNTKFGARIIPGGRRKRTHRNRSRKQHKRTYRNRKHKRSHRSRR